MSIISDEYAVYLPAVNEIFAKTLVRSKPDNRPLPDNFELSDLTFWNKNNPFWHHPHFLHSVGQYSVGTTPDNAVTRRGRTDGILFGDSGGYQIGKGSLKGLNTLQSGMSADEACTAWRNAYETRRWILGWLETYTNYAVTIDMPLWAMLPGGNDSPFHHCSSDQLTQLTVENLQFIDSHRQNRTKWLNVLQGENREDAKKWWDAVKWFPCSGYAIGGNAPRSGDLATVLGTYLFLCDDNAFENDRGWIHMLGVSTNRMAVIFTAIQKALRNKVHSDIRISFDSAAPFQQAGVLEEYVISPELGTDAKNWKFRTEKCPQSRLDVGSNKALPFSSPLADKLTLGHLSVRSGMYEKNQFDSITHALLTHHNVWTYLDSMQRANDLMFTGNCSDVPQVYKECTDLIAYIFGLDNWDSELSKHDSLFAEFAKA